MTTVKLKHNDLPVELNELSAQIVDAAYKVHKELGPGYFERIYEEALTIEFDERGIKMEYQKPIHVFYKNKKLNSEYKLDCLVEGKIILELKTVEKILPLHKAQLMSYMRMMKTPLGFLINFNDVLIHDGIQRVVMDQFLLRGFAPSRLETENVS